MGPWGASGAAGVSLPVACPSSCGRLYCTQNIKVFIKYKWPALDEATQKDKLLLLEFIRTYIKTAYEWINDE